jgi:hypothetical protein
MTWTVRKELSTLIVSCHQQYSPLDPQAVSV